MRKFLKAGSLSIPEVTDPLRADILADQAFMTIYHKITAFSMVDLERCFALYQSVKYILANNIPGDFVECGVWKGGSCMLIAYTLQDAGVTDKHIWLYDTFSGMTKPGEKDGIKENELWRLKQTGVDSSDWCLATREEVEKNMIATGYPYQKLHFVEGKVEVTIPKHIPGKIALLRLDTDWYESTFHELQHLYPLLEKGGILILDDYGLWPGCKKATDEYFGNLVFLHRIDRSARLLVK